MVEYYQQRANAGLIITEATVISPKAVGYAIPQAYGHKNKRKLGIKLLKQCMRKVQKLWFSFGM
jgi:2,4-dienoyl-CoA reductase-like NADH-dependent reductase (Old Yellow Enzyme family)